MSPRVLSIFFGVMLTSCDRNRTSAHSGESSSESPPVTEAAVKTPSAKEGASLALFSGSLGESFSHPPSIGTLHDPHRGATRVDFFLTADQFPIGSMFVRALPQPGTDEIFEEAGIGFLENRYEARNVKFAKAINPGGFEFLTYRGECEVSGKPHRIFEFIFLDREKSDDLATSMLREGLGAFQFLFIFPEEKEALAMPALETVMNTFQPKRIAR